MTIGNFLENALLNAVYNATAFGLSGNPFVSLHTADPGETGASEVVGGSYARQQADFAAAAGGATSNAAAVEFTGMPAVTVTHVGIWDAVTVGNFLWGGPLTTPRSPSAGDTLRFLTGEIDVTLD